MGWDLSALDNVVAWCETCGKGVHPATGAPVAASANALMWDLPLDRRCATCNAPLSLRRRAPETASRATVIGHLGPTGPAADARVTAVDPPHDATVVGPAAGLPPLGRIEQARIGPFHVVRELGRGGMGVVYLALDDALGRQCALKVLPFTPDVANDREFLARFEREARATAQLSHPNLVAVHSVGETPGCRYIAMDFVAGRSLDALFAAEGMAPERAIRIVWQAALGLGHAHAQGVVHRDIKPSNILVEHVPFAGSEMRLSRRERSALELAGRFHAQELAAKGARHADADGQPPSDMLVEDLVRVTDFGLAVSQQSHRLTVEGAILGTPSYMSPEQTLGRSGEAQPSMDVYGLGATLYELLTGGPPFVAAETAQLFRMIQDTEPTPPRKLNPKLDRDLENVVLKCLDKDPARRYLDAAELADDLRRWLDDEPVKASRPSKLEAWKRKVRRNPKQYFWSGAFVCLLLGLAGYFGAETWYRFHGYAEACRSAEAAMKSGDLAAARRDLDAAAAFRPDAPATAMLAERLDRLSTIARTLALGEERMAAWKQAKLEVRERERQRMAKESALPSHAGAAARAPLWQADAELAEARMHETAEREAAASYLRTVLQMDPAQTRAQDALVSLTWTLLVEAEAAGEASERRHWEAKLRELDAGRAEKLLARPGRIRLTTEPAGAKVSVYRYVEAGKLLLPLPPGEGAPDAARLAEVLKAFEADPEGKSMPTPAERAARSAFLDGRARPAALGTTPVDAAQPPGFYLLVIEAAGREPVRLPVPLGRDDAFEAKVVLPEAGTIPAGFVYVPAGRFRHAAGETDLPEFCVGRFEVTNGDYLAFLNDPETLAEVKRADGGIRRVPRAAPRDGALWTAGADGRYALPAGLREDAPVCQVDLDDARAYARWFDRVRADAHWTFDLPTEMEWEKAARGTDGRVYPWGNAFDPALCAMVDSTPGKPVPVGSFPADESPYGVRDMAGSACEWTLTGDDAHGYATKGGSWTSEAHWCRADDRDLDLAWELDDENGIRLVARRK